MSLQHSVLSTRGFIAGVVSLLIAAPAAAEPVSFCKDIAPLLLNQCHACHGEKKSEGDYRVDQFARVIEAGESGDRGVTAGKPDASELLRRLTSDDADERMPLKRKALPKEQIDLVRRWISEGAKFDGPDTSASLASIVPDPAHPDPPETYVRPIPITALAFSSDGNRLFAAGYHEMTVWNPKDGSLVLRIKRQGQRTYCIAVSPDGKTLATGSGTPGRLGEVRLFNATDGKLLTVLGRATDVVLDVAWSSDGARLATASADRTARLYDVAKRKLLWTASSHSDWVNSVAFSPDGKRIATASRDKTSKVLDAKDGRALATYSGHKKNVRGVAFHPSGKQVYTAEADRVIHLWDAANAKKIKDVVRAEGPFYRLTSGGEFLFSVSEDGVVRQHQAKDQKKVREYRGHTQPVFSAAFAPSTSRLATGSFDGEVRLWNTTDGKPVLTFTAAPGYKKPSK
jgi:WD40 repeat protein